MLPSRIRMIVDYTRSFCMNFNVTTLTRRFCCECHDRQNYLLDSQTLLYSFMITLIITSILFNIYYIILSYYYYLSFHISMTPRIYDTRAIFHA